MSVTDEIKARIDIVSYVLRFVPTLKKAGRNHKACCPFHNEKTPSFVVNPERQTWHCFGACAEGGDLFTFAQKMHKWDFKEALGELAQEAGVQLRRQTPQERTRDDQLERLRGIISSAADIYHKQFLHPGASAIQAYVFKKRSLSKDSVQSFQIGLAPESWDFALQALTALGYSEDEIIDAGLAARSDKGRVYDRFRNRLMIPIRDERGRVVGFGGRALDPNEPAKYINSPQSALFDKSQLLFGLDSAKAAIRDTGLAVIVEGYMDVIQAHQAGYRNVVAQMGTAMTEAQIMRITPRFANKIVIALDADEAGQSATRRSLEVARQTLARDYAGKLAVDLRILQVPSGKDPDDYLRETPEAWEGLVNSAQAVADFVIDMETENLSAVASMQERQHLARQILPILFASENNLYQQENIQKLARRLRISERDLLTWAGEQQLSESRANRRARSAHDTDPGRLTDASPPPEYWDNDADDVPPDVDNGHHTARPPTSSQGRAIEPYCLSLLLQHPRLLVQVNRKLRELAGNDDGLLNGPLRELCVEDFTQSQYRTLMAYLQEAMAQDDMEPLDFIGKAIDGELMAEYRSLLVERPATVSNLMSGVFGVDMLDILKRRPLRGNGMLEMQNELVSRALRLRMERLEQERFEMQYLQEEANADTERDPIQHDRLNQQIMLSMTAKARLDLAVS